MHDAVADARQRNLMLCIFALGAIVMFFLNALVDNAVVFHDEYVYKAAADLNLDQAETYRKGLNDYIPNRLFVLVYGLASRAGQNYYLAAQFFNVVFWALGLLAVCELARELGLRGRQLAGLAGLSVLLPFGMYSKYFMPESLYFLMFSVSALLFFRGFFLPSVRAMVGAGVVAGLAYYVKPHAVFIVAGSLLFLLCAGGPVRRRLRTMALYTAGFGVVVVAGRLLIDKPDHLATLGVYDQMARGMLSTLAAMFGDPGKAWRAVWTVAQGHLVILLSLWSIAILSALSGVRALRRGDAERQHYFKVWLLMLTTMLFGVVVAFTVLAGEVGRLHSRYYCFLYPFLLIALFAYQPGAHSRREKLLMSAVAVAAGLALLTLPDYAGALSVSLVSDAPELGFVFLSRGATLALALLLVAVQVAAVWRGRNALLIVLALVFVASQLYVRQAQSHMFRGPYTDGKDALMVQQLLGAERMKSALVLAESRDVLSKFLFNLTAIPYVRIQPLAQLADAVRDYPNASAYLLLTESFDAGAGLNCDKIGQRVVRCVRR
ncbi:MAG TPA: hypothetical protein VFS02_13180 [Telluria sp.]|nr:hypothetical protein [Telluria sp.]